MPAPEPRLPSGIGGSVASVRRRALTAGLVMAITVSAFEVIAVSTALPTISEDLGGDALYGTALSAFMVASLLALVVSGEWADRRGPARPFLAGVLVFGAGLVVVSVAPSMLVVVLGRVAQGLGAGAITNCSYVAVGRAWDDGDKPRVFALMSAAWVVPSLVGPTIAGWVTSNLSWRWVFGGIVPLLPVLVALSLPSLVRIEPTPAPPGGPAPSRVPTALVLCAASAVTLGGLQASRWPLIVALTAAGVALGVRPLRALLPRGTFRADAGAAGCIAARLAVNVAFFGVDVFVPLAATRLHDATPTQAGLVVIGSSLSWSVASAVVAKRLRADGATSMVRLGFAALGLSVLATVVVTVASVPLWVTFLAWVPAGFGMGLVMTTSSATALSGGGADEAGTVGSQLGIADALGFAAIAGVGGALVGVAERTAVTLPGALRVLFVGCAAVAALGMATGGRVREPRARSVAVA